MTLFRDLENNNKLVEDPPEVKYDKWKSTKERSPHIFKKDLEFILQTWGRERRFRHDWSSCEQTQLPTDVIQIIFLIFLKKEPCNTQI